MGGLEIIVNFILMFIFGVCVFIFFGAVVDIFFGESEAVAICLTIFIVIAFSPVIVLLSFVYSPLKLFCYIYEFFETSII